MITGEQDSAAALFRTSIDRFLNGQRIVGHTIAFGSIGRHVVYLL